MTPLQKLISKIEELITSSQEHPDQLLMVRAMAEMLLKEERQFIEYTYYQGRFNQKQNISDFTDYMESINSQSW
jgi:ElaB/YqjD/DUF883 family membrane-anchored ribosome-binding protein